MLESSSGPYLQVSCAKQGYNIADPGYVRRAVWYLIYPCEAKLHRDLGRKSLHNVSHSHLIWPLLGRRPSVWNMWPESSEPLALQESISDPEYTSEACNNCAWKILVDGD